MATNYLCNMNTGSFEKGKVYTEESIIKANMSASDKGNFQPIERKVLTKQEVDMLVKQKQRLVNSNTIVTK